jgi:hypothetical protein
LGLLLVRLPRLLELLPQLPAKVEVGAAALALVLQLLFQVLNLLTKQAALDLCAGRRALYVHAHLLVEIRSQSL